MKDIARRNRKPRVDRILILIIAILIPVAVIFGVIKLMSNNPHSKYDVYNEATKLAGDMKHESDEEEDQYYLSVYYPKYDNKVLDQAVKDFKEKELLKDTQEGMHYIMVDYDTETLFDRYTTLTFHQKIMDANDKVIQTKDTSYNYDKKTDKLLGVKDVLRRDYLNLLHSKAKESKLDTKLIATDNLSNFVLGKDKVSFYFNHQIDQMITIYFKENSNYIALADKNIPSLYQEEVVTPAAQPEVDKNKKLVAITFDDGPHYANTQEIMKEFEKYNGRATFFMLGQNVGYNPEIVQDMHKRGFELANHSWDHADLRTLDRQGVIDEIYNTQDAIYKLTGYEPTYFRPPYGALNDTVLNANQMGYAFWDVDSEDWRLKNASAIKNSVVSHTKAGNMVVLLHDIHEFSKDSVGPILAELDKAGYQFVTYSTLMEHEKEYLLQLDQNYGVPSEVANGK